MSCQKDQYLLALYALVSSLSVATSGIIVLFALGDLKPEEDAETKRTLESTSISIISPDSEDLHWKTISLRI